MNARFLPRPQRNSGGRPPEAPRIWGDALPPDPPRDRACCCPSRPAVRIVMPPSATRRHETELLLCGHHFRASRETLAAAGAASYELLAGGWDGSERSRYVPELERPHALGGEPGADRREGRHLRGRAGASVPARRAVRSRC